jgi:hypothetical protein
MDSEADEESGGLDKGSPVFSDAEDRSIVSTVVNKINTRLNKTAQTLPLLLIISPRCALPCGDHTGPKPFRPFQPRSHPA